MGDMRAEIKKAIGELAELSSLDHEIDEVKGEWYTFREASEALEARKLYSRNIRVEGRDGKYNQRRVTRYAIEVVALKRALGGLEGKRIVHIAGGHGVFANALKRIYKANAASLDVSEVNAMLGAKALGKVPAVVADARNPPIKPGSLDAIVSEHFLCADYRPIRKTEKEILEECRNALKPGGTLVITSFSKPGRYFKKLAKSGGWEVKFRYDEKEEKNLVILRKT